MPIFDPKKITYDPERIEIDPSTGTVEGRVASIINKGGPLQQVGETKALQQMQQRGLLNTSMAVGAAQKANIESALPIAQQDVQTSFAAQQANTQATNRAKEFEAGFFQQTGIIGAQTDAESRLMTQKENIDKRLLTAGADEQIRLILEKGQIDTQLQELKGTQVTEQLETSANIESRLQFERAEISKQLLTAEGQVKLDLINQQGEVASQLQSELFEINTQLQTAQAEDVTELEQVKGAIQQQLQELIGSQALERQGLESEQATILKQLEGDYNVLINTQRNAAMIYAETSNSISAILANPDIKTDDKQSLVDQQLTLLSSSLAIIGSIGDMDLVGLLDFGAPLNP